MTELKPNRGGHPTAPRNAAECRLRISYEVMQRGREHRLRQLWRLHRAFVESDKAEREERRTAAIVEQNRLKADELALKTASYRLRFIAAPLGQQALLRENERLKARITELELVLGNRGSTPTLTESDGDCAA